MKKKEITLAGKPVTLGYCYATEIAYKDMSGENINGIIQETYSAFKAKPAHMPDTKRGIYLVLAAILAYYQSKDEDAPIKDSDLMNDTTPLELSDALVTVINLYAEFYNTPKGEPEDKPAKGKGKKGKN